MNSLLPSPEQSISFLTYPVAFQSLIYCSLWEGKEFGEATSRPHPIVNRKSALHFHQCAITGHVRQSVRRSNFESPPINNGKSALHFHRCAITGHVRPGACFHSIPAIRVSRYHENSLFRYQALHPPRPPWRLGSLGTSMEFVV